MGNSKGAVFLFSIANEPEIQDFDGIIETACSHEINDVVDACASISDDWRAFLQTLRMKAAEIA